MKEVIKKADVLIEALPYIKAFRNKVTIIKYGGSSLSDKKIRRKVWQDIVFMSYVGMRPVVVHGGGPAIDAKMKKAGIKPKFIEGLRVTDKKTLSIVKDTLSRLNKEIVREIKAAGGRAQGINLGKEIIVKVRRLKGNSPFGLVGEITSVNVGLLNKLISAGAIPVISPLGLGRDNLLYNVNADDVAAMVAAKLKAHKLVLLTATQGIMGNEKDPSSLIPTLHTNQIKHLIKEGIIKKGMIPKVKAAIFALKTGVKKTHIIDSKTPHALLLEIFTDKGIGTQILA